jgi:hypothetical protein
MANYIMSLCSSGGLHHPVELTNSPFCHYTYSNLTKVLEFNDLAEADTLKFLSEYVPPAEQLSHGIGYRVLYHDMTKVAKPHSRCLAGRTYLLDANPVAAHLSLTAGFAVSALHVGTGRNSGGFAPPLSLERLEVDADKNAAILAQIDRVLRAENLPYNQPQIDGINAQGNELKRPQVTELTIFSADTGYGKAKFIAPMYDQHHTVVGAIRMRSGVKIWTRAASPPNTRRSTGAPRLYDQKYYLHEGTKTKIFARKKGDPSPTQPTMQRGIDALAPSHTEYYNDTMANGRAITVTLKRWNNLYLRSRKEAKMKDKPIDIVQVIICDAQTSERIFTRPMFLAITGKHKDDITAKEAHEIYRGRFSVEHCYRFCNQNLMMNKLQSPEMAHQERWLRLIQLAYWLLYVASTELEIVPCPVWQKYLPKNKDGAKEAIASATVSPAQAQKAMPALFATFDKKPFLPKKCKKGKGRKKGTIFPPRLRHPILRKQKKETKKKIFDPA